MSLFWIVLLILFVGACVVVPIFFMDGDEPIIRLDLKNSPLAVGKKFDLDVVLTWLKEQANIQKSKRIAFAFVKLGTYFYDTESELFEGEKKRFFETGECHLVLISGPGKIHEWHFLVENFILKEITEKLEPITLP